MDRLISVGRIFVSLALIGLGIEHFIFQDFITGRAPAWPEAIPGGVAWAYLTGAVFVAVAAALLTGKYARPAAVLAALLIFGWALVRQVPVLAGDSLLSGEWTKAGKALTFLGGLLAIAATYPRAAIKPRAETEPREAAEPREATEPTEATASKAASERDTPLLRFVNLKGEFVLAGRICLGIFLVMTGIQHFMFTEFVASLIPDWFPGDAVFWTYFAGVALIAGGTGLFISRTARLAALLSGLMVFSWFWIVHIPRTFVGVSDSIAVFEALAVSGIALLLAGAMTRARQTETFEARKAQTA